MRKKPELSISEVAYESGFKDVSCFSHVFKKADGTCYELSEIEDMIAYIDKKKKKQTLNSKKRDQEEKPKKEKGKQEKRREGEGFTQNSFQERKL